MTERHNITFDRNGVTVDAAFTRFARGGRLVVDLDGQTVAEIEQGYEVGDCLTDAGLRAAAISEIEEQAEFWSDPANLGDGDEVPAALVALINRAAGR